MNTVQHTSVTSTHPPAAVPPSPSAFPSPNSPGLPPLSDRDGDLLTRYFALKEDADALASESRCSPLAILLWLSRPDVAAYIEALRSLEDYRRRIQSLDSLTALLHTTTNPVELRRIATTILRATSPNPRPAPTPKPAAIQHLPQPTPPASLSPHQQAPSPTPRAETAPQYSSPKEEQGRVPLPLPPPLSNPEPCTPAPPNDATSHGSPTEAQAEVPIPPFPATTPLVPTTPPNQGASARPHPPVAQTSTQTTAVTSSPHHPITPPPSPAQPSPLHQALAYCKLPTELADHDPVLALTLIAELNGTNDALEDAELDEDDPDEDPDST